MSVTSPPEGSEALSLRPPIVTETSASPGLIKRNRLTRIIYVERSNTGTLYAYGHDACTDAPHTVACIVLSVPSAVPTNAKGTIFRPVSI